MMRARQKGILLGVVLRLVFSMLLWTFADWPQLQARLVQKGEQTGPGAVRGSAQFSGALLSEPQLSEPQLSEPFEPFQGGPVAMFLPLIYSIETTPVPVDTHTLLLAPAFVPASAVSDVKATRVGQGGAFARYFSSHSIQNLSSSSSANIVLTYYDHTGSIQATSNDMIAPNDSKFYDPNAIPFPQGFQGTIIVSSTQPIVAVSVVQNQASSGTGAYASSNWGDDTSYLPTIKRNFLGYDTAVTVYVQQATTSQFIYTNASGPCQESINLGAHQTRQQLLGLLNLPCLTDGAFSAQVSSGSGSLVATALQIADNRLAAYEGIPARSAAPVLLAPLVKTNEGFNTGMMVQNTSNVNANVTVRLTPSGTGLPCSLNFALSPGANRMLDIDQATKANADCGAGQGWLGSAIIQSDGGAWEESSEASAGFPPLVGAVTLMQAGGDSAAYAMIKRNDTTGYVALPYLPFGHQDFVTDIYVMNASKKPQQIICSAQGNNLTVTLPSLQPYLVAEFNFRPGPGITGINASDVGPQDVDEEDHGECESCKECDPDDQIALGAAAIERGRLAAVVMGISNDSFFLYGGMNFVR